MYEVNRLHGFAEPATAPISKGPRPAPARAQPAPHAAPTCSNPLDARAKQIIASAQDTSVAEAARAVRLVRQICIAYFPDAATKVKKIQFVANEPGLSVTYEGQGAAIRGIISVGSYFLRRATAPNFARRVLQLGHELQHIDQQRRGMGGPQNQAMREFLAHAWGASTRELPGTGCVRPELRVKLIDAALGYFYCMNAAQQKRYAKHPGALLRLRALNVKASRATLPAAPTACRRP